ncbi:MarR family winged helix-turn-helix transcriptional regulator [Streptomyces sp. bgisy130]|uniref:MarR family winged helix-turn-helix transcriptional regulator n=1 Tax=Streptomyces sp. bgisy130 TaxID=3413788 RepID=UPI003F4A15F3
MKPIGYWLNRTDQALTRQMNDMLDGVGLTRIAWQVLNVIQDTPRVADTEVRATLSANADIPTLTAAIDAVLVEGWATRPAPNRLSLTPEGSQRLAHVAERVDMFRKRATAGISQDEYGTAVRVLGRMTRNLEAPTDAVRGQ